MQAERMSPKQQFDMIQEQIKADNRKARGETEDEALEKAVDAVEDFLGDADERETETEEVVDSSPVVTQAENETRKAKEAEAKAFEDMRGLIDTFATAHLSKEQQKKLASLFHQFKDDKIEDPILRHLISQRIKTTGDYLKTMEEVKEMNKRLFEQLSALSSNLTKVKGALEHVDKEILDYVVPCITT